jgi:hypothetical protein
MELILIQRNQMNFTDRDIDSYDVIIYNRKWHPSLSTLNLCQG